jgi:hypothetical protein
MARRKVQQRDPQGREKSSFESEEDQRSRGVYDPEEEESEEEECEEDAIATTVVPDGFTLRTPLVLMDSMQRDVARHAPRDPHQHRPGFVTDRRTDAQLNAIDKAYADYDNDMNNAYRGDSGGVEKQGELTCIPDKSRQDSTADARAREYELYDREQSEAWARGK